MALTTNSQRSVRQRRPAGRIGQLSGSMLNRVEPYLSFDPQAPQISTLTAANFSSGKVYSWNINGVADSYTTVSGDTDTTGAATKIAAKINANPAVRGQVRATSNAAVVTLTSTYPGLAFTVAGGSDLAAATTQSAALAAAIPLGRVVLYGASQPSIVNEGYSERLANQSLRRALVGNATARVLHLTPTAVNSTIYGVTVLVGGRTYSFSYTSDGNATVQEIVEGLELAFPAAVTALGIVASEDDTKLILTGPAGLQFDAFIFGAGPQVLAVSAAGSNLELQIAGITSLDDAMEVATVAGTSLVYPANKPVSVLEEGELLVESTETIALGDPVFVSLDTADAGRCYRVTGTNRTPVFNRLRWQRRAASPSDDLALLRVMPI
jgi:hypothetical protein